MGLAILLVDDDAPFADRLGGFLIKEGHHVRGVATGEECLRAICEEVPDVVLLDMFLPDVDGLTVLRRVRESHTTCAVMMMTAHGCIKSAVDAMRLGAIDYIAKPLDLDALSLKIATAHRVLGVQSDLDYLLAREDAGSGFHTMVGSCAAMRGVCERIREVAKTDCTTVLVTGATGTGKELVARAIHKESARRRRPLMEIDCTAIPLPLLESELFGHERGAFTGAHQAKKGLFELADGGTLLLDEIGDMARELQSKLLRVLQERHFRRVGGTRDIRVDVRVIAATHQDLGRLVDEGRFRHDLFYRLNVYHIELPPLRERGDDIIEIADVLIREFSRSCRKDIAGLDLDAREALRAYGFPGNIRELRNIIEQAVIVTQGSRISRAALSLLENGRRAKCTSAGDNSQTPVKRLALDELGDKPLLRAEKELIDQALQRTAGNKNRAAKLLGISRYALQRRLEKLAREILHD